MKSYTKVYLSKLSYGLDDFIPSEISGRRAVDVHHIYSRKKRPELLNEICNLMALTREEHERYGDKVKYMDYLIKIHIEFLDKNKVEYENKL